MGMVSLGLRPRGCSLPAPTRDKNFMNQRVLCLKIGAENKGRQTSHIFYHVDPKASVSLWVSRKVLGTSYVFTLGRKVIGVEGREWVPRAHQSLTLQTLVIVSSKLSNWKQRNHRPPARMGPLAPG